ncbi:Polyadenylate-binding protein 2 [Ananas comosus]|uniref:Polyadenylate-binding protein 2 n=1 Tax=Ananas comosus TaxID=4615 RepID=A0A199USN1_ANACO|nr:Polyadenylate-binding protein 2 [Ananas comosus]
MDPQDHTTEHEYYADGDDADMDDADYDHLHLGASSSAAAAEEEGDPNSKPEEIEDMKKRLKEIEDEAGALREMQAKVEKEMAAAGQDSSSAAVTQAEKEEVDSRSIYVGNVCAKRTNIPGMKQYRGRRPSPYGTFRSRRPYMPPPFYSPMGYGKAPRFRRPMRYRPYY